MELPSSWLWVSGLFFFFGCLLFVALIIGAVYALILMRSLAGRVTVLTQRVETVSKRVEELVVSAKEVTGQAKGIAGTLGGIAVSSAQKLELITTILFAVGALAKLRKTLGNKKK